MISVRCCMHAGWNSIPRVLLLLGLGSIVSMGNAPSTSADQFVGTWQGHLGETGLRFVLRLKLAQNGRLTGLMNSPDEESGNLPVSRSRVDGITLHLTFSAVDGTFEGTLGAEGREVNGVYINDSGARFEVRLTKVEPGFIDFLDPRVDEDGQPIRHFTYQPPPQEEDGWLVAAATPETQEVIEDIVVDILEERYLGIEGLVVVQHNRLLAEEYFYGYERHRTHQVRSITKGLASILTGVALQKGMITSVDTPVASFFAEEVGEQKWSTRKQRMTLAQVLTMTSGLRGNDWEDDYAETYRTWAAEDWVDVTLRRPVVREPGSRFAYNGSSLMLLSGILAQQAEMAIPAFAEQHLFAPLGIEQVGWMQARNGATYFGSGLRMRPRDLAKIGQLMLNGGAWNGERILSQEWVTESTTKHVALKKSERWYGYLWWIREAETRKHGTVEGFYLSGKGGQFVFVVPALELVVVLTAGNYDREEPRLKTQGYHLVARILEGVEATGGDR